MSYIGQNQIKNSVLSRLYANRDIPKPYEPPTKKTLQALGLTAAKTDERPSKPFLGVPEVKVILPQSVQANASAGCESKQDEHDLDESKSLDQSKEAVVEKEADDSNSTEETSKKPEGLTKNQKRKLKQKRKMKDKEENKWEEMPKKPAKEFSYKPPKPMKTEGEISSVEIERKTQSLKSSKSELDETSTVEGQDESQEFNPYESIVEILSTTAEENKEKDVENFFSELLRQYCEKNSVKEEEKRISQETTEGIGYLMEALQKGTCSTEMLESLLQIRRQLSNKDYQVADQAYFSLSIGKSTLYKGRQGMLEDERQRKMLQSVKRLMTFWQTVMAPTLQISLMLKPPVLPK